MVPLGEVLRRIPANVEVDRSATYNFAGVYSFGRGVFRSVSRMGSQVAYSKLTRIQCGDFVYPKLMAWEGAFGVVPQACDGCYVSPEFPVFRPLTEKILSCYLDYYFRIPRVWDEVSGGSIGTNVRRRRLHPVNFLKAKIPLPPLSAQRRIIARIDELAAQINEARELREQSIAEAESLLAAMAHRADLDEFEKRRQGWRRKLLSEAMQFVDDSQKVDSTRQYPNLGIFSFGRGLFHKPPIEGIATSANALRRVKAGQFIYSRLFAFEGAYGQVTPEFDGAYVSMEYPTFDCDPQQVRAEFLAAYFKPQHVWKAVAVGSKGLGDRRQRVQPAQILAHELWIPPISWQNRLAEVQAQVDRLKRLQTETAAELDALLPSILDKAFKGKL